MDISRIYVQLFLAVQIQGKNRPDKLRFLPEKIIVTSMFILVSYSLDFLVERATFVEATFRSEIVIMRKS